MFTSGAAMSMVTFISYAHAAEGTPTAEFVTWLYDRLNRPDSPLRPLLDKHDMILGEWRKHIDQLIPMCEIMLVVWTPDWDVRSECQNEFHQAENDDVLIAPVTFADGMPHHPRLSRFTPVHFAADRERAAQELFRKVVPTDDPVNRVQHLGRRLDVLRVRAGRPGFTDHEELADVERALREAQQQSRRRGAAQPAAKRTVPPAMHGERPFLNRDHERRDLLAAVRRPVGGLVVVSGAQGVGKTSMMIDVLRGLERDTPGLRHWFQPVGSRHAFVAGDLITTLHDLLADDGAEAADYRPKDPVDVKLKALLELPGTQPVLVVLDCAEQLLDGGSQLLDSDLDNALELLYGQDAAAHRITVVLVTRTLPASPHRSWPSSQNVVPVRGGLGIEHFTAFLRQLAVDGMWFRDDQAAALHRGARGLPRVAELTYGLLKDDTETYTSIEDVLGVLDGRPATEMPPLLLGELVGRLGPDRLRVAAAVAAYGRPASVADVLAVLDLDPAQSARVGHLLWQLVVRKVISQVSADGYLVQSPDREGILDQLVDGDRTALLLAAARHVGGQGPASVTSIHDLDGRRQQIELLLRARQYVPAFHLVNDLDQSFLYPWGFFSLLTGQREVLRGKLTEPVHQLVNLNALGRSYAARRRHREAVDSFRAALEQARRLKDRRRTKQLTVNLASAHFESGDTPEARRHYNEALHLARRLVAPPETVAPLQGLAACARRHGRFRDSLGHLDEAIGIALADPDPAQLAGLLLSAGRIHLHLDERARAEARFAEADGYIDRVHDGRLLRCRHLDAVADMSLRAGRPGIAITHAATAVDLALDLGDSGVLRQARTTLAAAHLAGGGLAAAREEIRLAENYRSPWRSLVTLVYGGLIDMRVTPRLGGLTHFRQLRTEAAERQRIDGDDFGAWNMRGMAICGLHACTGSSLDGARNAFGQAGQLTSGAPGVLAQLHVLLDLLVAAAPEPEELKRLAAAVRAG